MGLIINKQTTLYDELIVDSIYIRLYFRFSLDSKLIHITYFPYLSKESFKANPNNMIKLSFNLNRSSDLTLEYDRETDGVDILMLVHDAIKASLSTDVIKEVDSLNIDGSVKVDDQGVPVKEDVIVRDKFVDDASITNDLLTKVVIKKII
jgi:hypothetical protein